MVGHRRSEELFAEDRRAGHPLRVDDEVRGQALSRELLVVLEAGAGAGDPVAGLSLGGEADDVEGAAAAEIGNRAGVVDADARALGQVLRGPAAERDLLALNRVRRLRQIGEGPGELHGHGPGDEASQERGDEREPRAHEADQIPGLAGETGNQHEPGAGEGPDVADAVPEEAEVAARDQRAERDGGDEERVIGHLAPVSGERQSEGAEEERYREVLGRNTAVHSPPSRRLSKRRRTLARIDATSCCPW